MIKWIYLNVNLVVLRPYLLAHLLFICYHTTGKHNGTFFFCETEEKSSYVKHIAICV